MSLQRFTVSVGQETSLASLKSSVSVSEHCLILSPSNIHYNSHGQKKKKIQVNNKTVSIENLNLSWTFIIFLFFAKRHTGVGRWRDHNYTKTQPDELLNKMLIVCVCVCVCTCRCVWASVCMCLCEPVDVHCVQNTVGCNFGESSALTCRRHVIIVECHLLDNFCTSGTAVCSDYLTF